MQNLGSLPSPRKGGESSRARNVRGPRSRELFLLGLSLARGRTSVTLSLVFAGLVTLGCTAVAAAMAARGRVTAAAVPGFASELLAWGPGMLLVFAAGLHALRSDAQGGVFELAAARGVSLRSLVVGRVLSLMALLGGVTAGGTFIVMCAAALGARSSSLAFASIHGGLAGVVHGLAFGLVMAPVALATIGSRSRAGGYVALVLVVVVPELARFVVLDLPREWTELMSIPSALVTVRSALSPGRVDLLRMLGAVTILVLVALVGFAATLHRATSLASPEDAT